MGRAMHSTTALQRLTRNAGLGLMLASLVTGVITAISPSSAGADACSDGLTMDQSGQCVPVSVNEASSGSGNKATPGSAAQQACQAAVADADANSIGAETADIPCP